MKPILVIDPSSNLTQQKVADLNFTSECLITYYQNVEVEQ